MIVLAKQFRYPYRGFVITLKAKNGNIYALWSNGNRTFRKMFRNVRMIGNETRPIKDYIEDAIDKMVGPWPQARAMRYDPQPNPAYSKSWDGYRGGLRENPNKPIYTFGPESFVKPPVKPPVKPSPFPPSYGPSPIKPSPVPPSYRPPVKPPGVIKPQPKPLPKPGPRPSPGLLVNFKNPYADLRRNPARGFKVTKVETSGGVTWEWLNNFLGEKLAKRIAANTEAIRQSDGSIAIRLYSTKILIYSYSGAGANKPNEIELRLGGWNTPTTRNRINALLPYGWGIFNKGGIPYVSNASGKATEVPPSDKITLTETGAYV